MSSSNSFTVVGVDGKRLFEASPGAASLYKLSAVNGKTSDHAEEKMSSENMNDLSEDEAYAILGLEKPSSKSEISKAHKSLIQKLHPDRGGSDYLAAKINAAKDKIS